MSNVIERARAWLEVSDRIGMGDGGPASIIRDLLAIVERLPLTADGVPVVPGMDVWLNPRVCVRAWIDPYGIVLQFPSGTRPLEYDPNTKTEEPIYSTLDAAVRAVGGGG